MLHNSRTGQAYGYKHSLTVSYLSQAICNHHYYFTALIGHKRRKQTHMTQHIFTNKSQYLHFIIVSFQIK